MPIVLMAGGTLIAYATDDQLRLLARLCWIALSANRLNEWVMTLPAGYRLGQRDAGAMMWMAPCKYPPPTPSIPLTAYQTTP